MVTLGSCTIDAPPSKLRPARSANPRNDAFPASSIAANRTTTTICPQTGDGPPSTTASLTQMRRAIRVQFPSNSTKGLCNREDTSLIQSEVRRRVRPAADVLIPLQVIVGRLPAHDEVRHPDDVRDDDAAAGCVHGDPPLGHGRIVDILEGRVQVEREADGGRGPVMLPV